MGIVSTPEEWAALRGYMDRMNASGLPVDLETMVTALRRMDGAPTWQDLALNVLTDDIDRLSRMYGNEAHALSTARVWARRRRERRLACAGGIPLSDEQRRLFAARATTASEIADSLVRGWS